MVEVWKLGAEYWVVRFEDKDIGGVAGMWLDGEVDYPVDLMVWGSFVVGWEE